MTTAKQGDVFLCFFVSRNSQTFSDIEPEIIRLGGPQHIVASSTLLSASSLL